MEKPIKRTNNTTDNVFIIHVLNLWFSACGQINLRLTRRTASNDHQLNTPNPSLLYVSNVFAYPGRPAKNPE
jgi:hypothetical protein